jgi:hypothetical protein
MGVFEQNTAFSGICIRFVKYIDDTIMAVKIFSKTQFRSSCVLLKGCNSV